MAGLRTLGCWVGGVAALLAGTAASASRVQQVSVRGDRIVVRFDAAVKDASTTILTAPRGIAIDVAGVTAGPLTTTGPVRLARQSARG